jgi:hypothetical protein
VGEAEQCLHGGDVGVDGRRAAARAVRLRAHGLKSGLNVLDCGALDAGPNIREGFDEAAANAVVGAKRMVRAIGMRLEPHGKQVEIGRRVGVNLR